MRRYRYVVMANKEFTERLPMTLLLSQLPIVVEYERPEQIMKDILALARVKKLSSYEASYLYLAIRKGLPLATLDKRLKQAAMVVDVKILRI